MVNPERPAMRMPVSSGETELLNQIAEIERQLEIVDANENQIEREAQREALLEQLDILQAKNDTPLPDIKNAE